MERAFTHRILAALAFASTACTGETPDPAGPTRPSVELAGPGESRLLVESSGTKPDGFSASVLSDPKRNEDGVIEGPSPVTVAYDACGSRSAEGTPLFFYFDWDFDHAADIGGGSEACRQQHTYVAKRDADEQGRTTHRTNVCVATGDLRRHDPTTYVSCRAFTVVVAARGPSCRGPADDRFPPLTVQHETFSPVAGNVFANDCRQEPLLGAFAIAYTNVRNVSFELTGDVHLICPEVGPFTASLYYVTRSGRADIFIEGDCT